MKRTNQTPPVWRLRDIALVALSILALCSCTRPLSSFIIPPPSLKNESDDGVGSAEHPVKVMEEGEWRAVRTGCERVGLLSPQVEDVEKWLLPEGRPSVGNAAAHATTLELHVCDDQWLRLPDLGPKEHPFSSEVPSSALKVDGHTSVVYVPLYSVFHDNGTDTWRLEVIVEDTREMHIVRRWRVLKAQRFGGPFG